MHCGVESCWVNFFDPDEVAKAFHIPENEEILTLFDLGYAADGTEALPNHFNRKPIEETVTYI